MAYAYTVKTSEDGLIGVYGKKSRALAAAKEYCGGDWNMSGETIKLQSTGQPFMWVYEGNGATAEVELWWLQ